MMIDRGDNECYIVDFCRSAFSKANPAYPERDSFGEIRGDQLLALVLKNMFEVRMKGKVAPVEVDEMSVGTALQVHDNWSDGGRNPWFLAGFPNSVPCVGMEKACGSSMAGMHHGIMQIWCGMADITLSGGFEHMSRVALDPAYNKHFNPPLIMITKPTETKPNPWYMADKEDVMCGYSMLQTAQKLFEEEYGGPDEITQEEMMELAIRSHKLTKENQENGFFDGEIVPITGHVPGKIDEPLIIDKDQCLRPGTTMEILKKLPGHSKPGYRRGFKVKLAKSSIDRKTYQEKLGRRDGVITAGVSSPLNAGAVAVLMMSKKKMEEKGLIPMARVVSLGMAGVDPSVMGRGPVPASRKALEFAGLTVDDIDIWEINEAFAVVVLNAAKKLKIPLEKINVNGGALAIGHPLGASGSRLTGTLARILKQKNKRYGCATLCCGGGQGIAVIIENMDYNV